MVDLTVVFESLPQSDEYAWEHGLNLLLNGADVEFIVQAIFICDFGVPVLSSSLLKKLKQLELYEIDSKYCLRQEQSELGSLVQLSFLQEIKGDTLSSIYEGSSHIVTV